MAEESLRQRPRPALPSLELSSDELTAVLQEASRLQGEALKQETEIPSPTSETNVFALAEELGIPEKHVRVALATQQQKKQSAGGGSVKSLVVAGAGGLLGGLGLMLVGAPALLAVPLAALIAGGIFAVGFIAAMMRRHPAKVSGPPPVPGTCRVCFRPAHTPQSTFCDEHRNKPTG
jgi:hypothetical protein